MSAFTTTRSLTPLGALPHLAQHLIGLDRDTLIDPPGHGVEGVGHRDDPGKDPQLARPDRLGIAGEVDHVVFVGNQDGVIGNLVIRAHAEERQRALPGMLLMSFHSRSSRPPALLRISGGTRAFPTSCNSAVIPRS